MTQGSSSWSMRSFRAGTTVRLCTRMPTSVTYSLADLSLSPHYRSLVPPSTTVRMHTFSEYRQPDRLLRADVIPGILRPSRIRPWSNRACASPASSTAQVSLKRGCCCALDLTVPHRPEPAPRGPVQECRDEAYRPRNAPQGVPVVGWPSYCSSASDRLNRRFRRSTWSSSALGGSTGRCCHTAADPARDATVQRHLRSSHTDPSVTGWGWQLVRPLLARGRLSDPQALTNRDERALEHALVSLEDERSVGCHKQRLELEGELDGIGV